MNCRVCRNRSKHVFEHQVLRKYDVQYFQCSVCGLLQTEEPYWLDEAYASAIVSADTGLMQRNLHMANVTAYLFWKLFQGTGKYLDVAGGYGIFTRLMRDIGFDYFWNDPHAKNLVARGFEGSATDGSYAAVTAFEVLEHLVNPLEFLEQVIQTSGAKTILVSTDVFEGPYPDPQKWWYYTFDTGQHITFFRRSTLQLIADKLGLHLYSNRSIHLWTSTRISPLLFKLITTPRLSPLFAVAPRIRLDSRIQADYENQMRQ